MAFSQVTSRRYALLTENWNRVCFLPRSERSVKLAFGIITFVKNRAGFREFRENSLLVSF